MTRRFIGPDLGLIRLERSSYQQMPKFASNKEQVQSNNPIDTHKTFLLSLFCHSKKINVALDWIVYQVACSFPISSIQLKA